MAPRNDIEKSLANIWEDILQFERIGIQDNFFELGGDSIISIQIIAKANQAGLKLKVKDLFQHPTIAELAAVAQEVSVATHLREESGDVLLLPIQQWFLSQQLHVADHFNQAILLCLRPDVKFNLLEQVFTTVFAQHKSLFMRYHNVDGQWDKVTQMTLILNCNHIILMKLMWLLHMKPMRIIYKPH